MRRAWSRGRGERRGLSDGQDEALRLRQGVARSQRSQNGLRRRSVGRLVVRVLDRAWRCGFGLVDRARRCGLSEAEPGRGQSAEDIGVDEFAVKELVGSSASACKRSGVTTQPLAVTGLTAVPHVMRVPARSAVSQAGQRACRLGALWPSPPGVLEEPIR